MNGDQNNDAAARLKSPTDFDARLRNVETGIEKINTALEHTATNKNLSDLKVHVSEMKTSLLVWMFGTVITVSIVAVGALSLFLRE